MGDSKVTDLTLGVYRRIYAGFLRGHRLNAVSLQAEAWFWRIHAVADDFGNGDGDPQLCRDATAGRRQVSTEDVAGWLDELMKVGLLKKYRVENDWYIHIADFRVRQPAGKNGKSVRRYPASPWDENEDAPGESGCIQVNPDSSSASDSHSHHHSHSDSESSAQRETSVSPLGSSKPPGEPLPCWTPGEGWAGITPDYRNELLAAYPACDIDRQLAAMSVWLKANPERAKKKRWRRFISNWLGKAQDRGGDRRAGSAAGNLATDRGARSQQTIDYALADWEPPCEATK